MFLFYFCIIPLDAFHSPSLFSAARMSLISHETFCLVFHPAFSEIFLLLAVDFCSEADRTYPDVSYGQTLRKSAATNRYSERP
jgi:hypothetical protein